MFVAFTVQYNILSVVNFFKLILKSVSSVYIKGNKLFNINKCEKGVNALSISYLSTDIVIIKKIIIVIFNNNSTIK